MERSSMTRQTMYELAEQVAIHLPGMWSVTPFPEDWGRNGAYLRCEKTQAILTIGDSQAYSERNKNRLSVGTDYPQDHEGHQSSAVRPRISVSATKSGKSIAADIERRLLPEYLPILDKELASNRAWNEQETALTEVAGRIARLVRVKRETKETKETTVSFYHSPYPIFRDSMSEARVLDKDEVELTLRLDVETALRVVELLVLSR